VLLARRAVEPLKGYWDLPGGFLETGEEPEVGVARELLEEAGLRAQSLDFFEIFMDRSGEDPDSVYTLNIYYLVDAPDDELDAQDDVAELRWFAPDELPEGLAFPHSRLVLDRWRAGLERN
jgi:ADP-ribose pyrophosphatase YjhB (NUDIX family)